jgi:hypothetical protein
MYKKTKQIAIPVRPHGSIGNMLALRFQGRVCSLNLGTYLIRVEFEKQAC